MHWLSDGSTKEPNAIKLYLLLQPASTKICILTYARQNPMSGILDNLQYSIQVTINKYM